MLRTPWSLLAQRSILSACRRLIARQFSKLNDFCERQSTRGPQRPRRGFTSLEVPWQAEVLEARLLLTPVASNDSYSGYHDQTLTSSHSVLANDSTGGSGSGSGSGGTMTAVLVSNPSHGSVSLSSNGNFTYTPSAGYVGGDSWTYKDLYSGQYSNVATVSMSVTDTTPTAVASSYNVYKDVFDSAAEGAHSVLYGASSADGDSLTATLVSGPSHGTLTLNSDGSFVYTQDGTGFLGADSFVFKATDALASSSNTTVTLNVASPFSAQTNAPDQPFAGVTSQGAFSASQLTGEVRADYPLGEGHDLTYASLTADDHPVIAVETVLGSSSIPMPDTVEMQTTYGGLTATTVWWAFGMTGPGNSFRFAQQVDASSLATGHYQYTVTLIAHYGSTTSTRVFTGYQDLVNRSGSEFGPGWSLSEADSLSIGTGGVLWVGGNIGTAWFTDTGSGTYSSPAGPLATSTLVKNIGGTYTLTDKYGNVENFSSAGLLTSRVDNNGNTTAYSYSSGKISSITDPYGRTTSFGYTSGLVTSVTDIASQTTTLAYTSGKLTSITAPVPATGISAPVTSYAYDSHNRMTSVTDPDGNATSLTYAFSGRLSGATFADTSTSSFTNSETNGLIDPSSGTGTSSNPATPPLNPTDPSQYQDQLSHQTTSTFDIFGDPLSSVDPLGNTTTWVRNANGQATQMTQPSPATGVAAPVTSYSFDSSGNLTQITYPDSTTETWTYGTSGGSLNRPLTYTDRRGKTTTYTYDSVGNMLTSTDALSNVTTMTFNSDGTVATIARPNPSTGGASGGLTTSFTYDSDGRVTRITNPDATHKDFTYNSRDQVVTSTDELGRVTTFGHDNDGRQTFVRLPNASTGGSTGGPNTGYDYDAAGNVISVTDQLGNITTYAFNSRGWLTSVTAPNPSTGAASGGLVTSYGYDATGKRTTVTDPLGNVTTTAYDADGRVTSVTQPDPDGSGPLSAPVTHYSYDHLGRVTSSEDPDTNTTDYAYNSMNEVTSVTDPLGKVTASTYNATGQVLTITAPNPSGSGAGPVTTYTYSDIGQLLTTTDALGNVTTKAYDHDGRLITVTAPNPSTGGYSGGLATGYTYDSLSRLSTETDPLGNITSYGYDAAGELTSVTAPNPSTGGSSGGLVTSYGFDGDGRQTTVTNPDSQTTTTAYNADGLVTSVTDADSNTTSYAFDHDGRETSVTDANSNTESYTLDANGQVTSKTDKNGQVTDFSYDNDGRLIEEQWLSSGTAIYTANWAYDAAGNLTSASDNNSDYAYTYNADNNVTQVDNNGTPTGPHVVINIGYDNMQRMTSQSATVAGTADFLNNYAYNSDSQITQISQQGQTGGNTVAAKLVNFAYDDAGRLTTVSRYANLSATQLVATSTYGYNAGSELTSLSQDKGATNLNAFTWSFDHARRVTGDTSVDGTDSYTYDAASQLTAATHSYETNESYSFDSTGNRTNTGYSTGTNNQLSSDGTYSYLYDANGNMTKKTTISSGACVTYTWDYRNRLTDVKAYNSSNALQSHEHYVYDVFNRLIERQVDPTGGGTYTTTQAFIYNGANVILVYNGSGTLTDRFLVTPTSGKGGRGGVGSTGDAGITGAFADENGAGVDSWLLADNEGTIRDVVQYNSATDVTTIVDHLEYNSFGVITSQSNSTYQPLFAYTGQMWDTAAGLFYYHARWYDASTGRFISQDPSAFAAGDPNLYRYADNSPQVRVDPTGMQSMGSGGYFDGPGPTGTVDIINMSPAEFAAYLAAQREQQRQELEGTLDFFGNPGTSWQDSQGSSDHPRGDPPAGSPGSNPTEGESPKTREWWMKWVNPENITGGNDGTPFDKPYNGGLETMSPEEIERYYKGLGVSATIFGDGGLYSPSGCGGCGGFIIRGGFKDAPTRDDVVLDIIWRINW